MIAELLLLIVPYQEPKPLKVDCIEINSTAFGGRTVIFWVKTRDGEFRMLSSRSHSALDRIGNVFTWNYGRYMVTSDCVIETFTQRSAYMYEYEKEYPKLGILPVRN